MSFRKPYRRKPISPEAVYLATARRKRKLQRVWSVAMFGAVFVPVFALVFLAPKAPAWNWVEAKVSAKDAGACVWSVHDGDTIRLCNGERIRIANIDAPEMAGSPKCEDYRRVYAWCDFEAGYRAKAALKAFLDLGPVRVARQGKDKYGRTLATLAVNGKDAGEHLITIGLANRWN